MICDCARVNSDSRDTLDFCQSRKVQVSWIWDTSVQIYKLNKMR